jgi:hypothetical protein
MNINPLTFAFMVLFVGLGSLLLPAIKKSSTRKLFSNPAFIIGDFMILPVVGFLVFELSFKEFSLIILIISLFLTLFSGIKFKLIKYYWVPHGIFYFTFTYIVLNYLYIAVRGGAIREYAYNNIAGGISFISRSNLS